jgi:hypothetical protein
MQLDEAVHRGEEKTGEMVRKEMREVEEMQQRLWKGWESENVSLRRQLAESAQREVEQRNAAIEQSQVAAYSSKTPIENHAQSETAAYSSKATAPSFDDSEKTTRR